MSAALAHNRSHYQLARQSSYLIVVLALVGLMIGAPIVRADHAPNSLGLEARYTASAVINWSGAQINVLSTAAVVNSSDQDVTHLSFNLLPARLGQIKLGAVQAGGQAASAVVEDQTIVVSLPQTLLSGASVPVSIQYQASFSSDASFSGGLFYKNSGVMNVYRWIPWLSRATRYDRPNFGEPFVTTHSPEVRVELSAERALKYATSGRRVANVDSGRRQSFVAYNVSDFNFSASPNYKVTRSKIDGIVVAVYYNSLDPSLLINWTRRALRHFGGRLGEYPYRRLNVAEIPSGSGMESPGLIWISNKLARSSQPHVVVHEVAHQWFYAVVASDQAREPFADEALAEFMARDMLASWRSSKCSRNNLDGSIYDYSRSCYGEVIYIQGAQYLRQYRDRVGETSFWRGMRDYYSRHKFRLGGTRQLLDALDSASEAKPAHKERFLNLY